MAGKLQQELGKRLPFNSLELEAYLNIVRTADVLVRDTVEVLKPVGLSPTQYNVLRILRGVQAGGALEGLPCGEIADRMLTRDPDVTRLLDRLEKRGLVSRCRAETDRRVVRATITPAGLKLIEGLEDTLSAAHRRQLAHLGDDGLRQLIELLESARQPPG